ncbi:MAG: AAA family ATPase [Bacteroidota bacterium]
MANTPSIPSTLGPYTVSEEVYRSRNTTIYRARQEAKGSDFILKVPTQTHDVNAAQRIATERSLLADLTLPGVPPIDDSAPTGMLARSYVPGLPLESIIRNRTEPFSIETAQALMEHLAEIIGGVHRAGISHRDLHPANILLHEDTGALHLIDFGLASRNDFTSARLLPPQQLEGTLRYLAPEQTGRMNRGVDYRADLYSLGIIFYELLTGAVPFEHSDAMELVHAHLAIAPMTPQERRPEVPEILSQIVLRLLAKSPEARYQSAEGLLHDLQQARAATEGFTLGTQDAPLRFEISQELYGRDEERTRILSGFAQIREHGKQLWLLGGPSGMGKSALAAELHRPTTEARGLFLSGKFDQLNQGITHVAWRQILEQLAQHILSEPEATLQTWRTTLQMALGTNGRVLTDLSPGLEQVLGEQEALTELDSMEAQNRFHLVLRRFFSALAQADRPLVLFLDDWQWADQASMNLLQELLQDPDLNHVQFVCAYRDNEVDPSHAFYQLFIDEQEEDTSWHTEQMTLQPLQPEHVRALLRDTLRQEPEYLEVLAQHLHQKTLGNAFFLHQLLKSLHEQGILSLQEAKGRLAWTLDQSALEGLHITDNVVGFMMERLQDLAEESLTSMQAAACIGNRFSVALLADVLEVTTETALAHLAVPLKTRLLVPLAGSATHPTQVRFVHDSIQKACYELIPTDERAPLHLRLAERWEASISSTPEGADLFAIVNAYNTGITLVTEASDRIRIATLNLNAAKEADRLPAYETALDYARAGLMLASEEHWKTHPTLMRNLHMLALKTGYFLNIGAEAQQ